MAECLGATPESEQRTMNAYLYQAALYCEECAQSLRADLRAFTGPLDREESDRWPIGPYADGGGEADCPQHCDHCLTFLENPLTTDGWTYVREAITEAVCAGRYDLVACTEWAPFYGYPWTDEGDAA